jgi:hypothetical protein
MAHDEQKEAEDQPAGEDGPGWVASAPTPEFLAALREGIDKAIQTAGPDFGDALKTLDAAVKRVPPRDLINFISLYYLSVAAGTNPEFDRPDGIFQNRVELIQAVALRQPLEDAKPEISNHDGVNDIAAAATALTNAFIVLETARIAKGKSCVSRNPRKSRRSGS